MPPRSRTANVPAGTGTYYKYFFGTVQQGSVPIPGFKGTCTDVVDGTFRDHPLTIEKVTFQNVTLTARAPGSPENNRNFVDYTPGYFQGATFGHLPLPPVNDGIDATKTFARTNPSRTVVDVPSFIGELRELPSLFKNTGKTLLKRSANAYLEYQYGWKPLIKDLTGFLDFQAQVMKREQELNNLFNKGGLRRRFQLSQDSNSSVTNGNLFLESALATLISGKRTSDTTRNRWATARWNPTVTHLPKTDAELHKLAVQAVYGLSVNVHSAWNLIPWSWLVDWATSVGDYLDAHRNSVGASCGGVCIMTHTQTVHRFLNISGVEAPNYVGIRLPRPIITVDSKSRVFSTGPTLTADLPFLSGNQVSILGALQIQRIRGV